MSVLALPSIRYVPSRSTGHVAQVTAYDVHLFDPEFIRVERDKLRVQAASCDPDRNPFTRWADEIDFSLKALGLGDNQERQQAASALSIGAA